VHPIAIIAAYEGVILVQHMIERRTVYNAAEVESTRLGVPLLVVGCPKWGVHHGHGDATLDLEHIPGRCRCPNPITANLMDVDKILPPKSAVIYSSHVLEHLTAEEGNRAVEAMNKVAVAQFHVWPSKWHLSAWAAPSHRSWPRVEGNTIVFEDRNTV